MTLTQNSPSNSSHKFFENVCARVSTCMSTSVCVKSVPPLLLLLSPSEREPKQSREVWHKRRLSTSNVWAARRNTPKFLPSFSDQQNKAHDRFPPEYPSQKLTPLDPTKPQALENHGDYLIIHVHLRRDTRATKSNPDFTTESRASLLRAPRFVSGSGRSPSLFSKLPLVS